MSKGSNRRPAVVDDAELEERWARIFAKPLNHEPTPAEPDPPEENSDVR